MISTKERAKYHLRARPRSRTHSVSIIGAGRLGLALGIALSKAGYAINLVVARSSASAKHAATLLKTTGEHVGAKGLTKSSRRSLELIASSSIIIVATPDDAIPGVAENLAAAFQSLRLARGARRPVAVHTSGALSSRALQPLKAQGISIGSIHPLISISDKNGAGDSLSRAFFSLEGDPAAIRLGKRLVHDLGGRSFVIDARSKPLYHAAAVMASPNLTALLDIALEMLSRCGISARRGRQILLPLVQSTWPTWPIRNLPRHSPGHSSVATWQPRESISKRWMPRGLTDALRAYAVLGQHSLGLSKLPKARSIEIEQLLTQTLSAP